MVFDDFSLNPRAAVTSSSALHACAVNITITSFAVCLTVHVCLPRPIQLQVSRISARRRRLLRRRSRRRRRRAEAGSSVAAVVCVSVAGAAPPLFYPAAHFNVRHYGDEAELLRYRGGSRTEPVPVDESASPSSRSSRAPSTLLSCNYRLISYLSNPYHCCTS